MKGAVILVLGALAAGAAYLFGKKKEPVPPPGPATRFPAGGLPIPPSRTPDAPADGGARSPGLPQVPGSGSEAAPPPILPIPLPNIDLGWKPLPGGPPASGIPKPPGWPETMVWPPAPPVYWPNNIAWPPVASSAAPYGWPNWLSWPPSAPTQPPTFWPLNVPFPVQLPKQAQPHQ